MAKPEKQMNPPTGRGRPSIGAMRGGAKRTGAQLKALRTLSAHAVDALQQSGRDVSARSIESAVRAASVGHVDIVVAGEFKAGKTTLINGILGRRILPTDPLATGSASTRIRPGAEVTYAATVIDFDANQHRLEPLTPAQFSRLAGLDGPMVGSHPIEQFHVACPHPLLDLGIRLIDTPGVTGGLKSVSARRVLQQAGQATAMIWVTNASRELTGSEIEFLSEVVSGDSVVLVVMTHIDVCQDWQLILERNEAHLAGLNRVPQVLAVGAGLQQLAVRLKAPDIERESGFPLLSWYIGLTVLTAARRSALVAAADLVASELAAVKTETDQRLSSLASVDSRRRLEESAQESLTELKALNDTWRYRLTGLQRESIKLLDEDLGRRFSELRDNVRSQVRQAETIDDWPAIEDAVMVGVNQVYAQHTMEVDRVRETTLAGVAETLGLSAEQLQGLQAEGDVDARPPLEHRLDEPEVSGYAERPTQMMDLLRTSAIGGSLAATTVGTLGVPFLPFIVPIVGAVGIGGLVGVRFMGRMRHGQKLDQWRARATPEIDRFLRQSESDIRRHAGRALDAFHLSLDVTVPGLIKDLLSERGAEWERLRKLADQADSQPSAQENDLRARRDRVELLAAHAQRLQLHLRRPDGEAHS